MQSVGQFIVRPLNDTRYDNVKSIGGINFITSTSEEDHKSANRSAVVVSVPLGYTGDIEAGDILLVHHNVFKFYNDMYGNRKSGKSYFKDGLFFIDNEQFFIYKHNNKWVAHDRYCFVEPAPIVQDYIYSLSKHQSLVGIMRYPSQYLVSQGVNDGDKVLFTPESEYEFFVDGVKMYRIYDHQITAIL